MWATLLHFLLIEVRRCGTLRGVAIPMPKKDTITMYLCTSAHKYTAHDRYLISQQWLLSKHNHVVYGKPENQCLIVVATPIYTNLYVHVGVSFTNYSLIPFNRLVELLKYVRAHPGSCHSQIHNTQIHKTHKISQIMYNYTRHTGWKDALIQCTRCQGMNNDRIEAMQWGMSCLFQWLGMQHTYMYMYVCTCIHQGKGSKHSGL